MTLLVLAIAAAVTYTAYHTRVTYWRYIAALAPLLAITVVGIQLFTEAGGVRPLLLLGFLSVLACMKVLALLRAHQLSQHEQARAGYRFATAKCPTCGQTKDRALPICAQCEWTLAAARAGTIVVTHPQPLNEAA